MSASRSVFWVRVASAVVACAVVGAAWQWTPLATGDLRVIPLWLEPHRHAWYALPGVMLAFVALGLAMVPVMLLIVATGVAFGPVMGPLYAMAGSLASASAGFAIGRWLGRRRVERLAGARIARVTKVLQRNGTLAVFFVRKIPAPFTLVNIVVGASAVRYRDFVVGTVLAMSVGVVLMAGFGHQLKTALRDPSPATWVAAVLFVTVPLMLAWAINSAFRRSEAR